MIKRPLFLAAVVLAAVFAFIYRFFPEMLTPSVPFSDRDAVILEGEISRIEYRDDEAHVFLRRLQAGKGTDASAPADMTDIRGEALAVVPSDLPGQLNLRIGNRVSASGTFRAFSRARNFGNFDEQEYYYSLGVFLKMQTDGMSVTDRRISFPADLMQRFRERMTASIRQSVPDPETAAILTAICTGDRSGLTADTRDLYRRSGIAHILAISGLHISILGMSVFRLLRRKFGFLPSAFVSSLLIAAFCMMCRSSPSARRALIMFLVQLAGIGLGKTYDLLCSASLAAILILLFHPWYIASSAFQLSFAAVLSVGVIYQNLRKEKGGHAGNKLLDGALLSISVTLGTLPLIASMYYEISLYSVLLNILIVPVMSLVLSSGMVSGLFGLVHYLIGRFFSGIGVYLVWFIRWICRAASRLPFSTIVTGCPSGWQIAGYYAALVLAVSFMSMLRRRRRRADNAARKYAERRRWQRAAAGAGCILVLLLILFLRFPGRDLVISFLDVGQGDGILLESPTGTVYLIDGGSSSVKQVADNRISPAVRYNGISRIDYSIITHPDTDHLSGILQILDNPDEEGGIRIGHILIPEVPGNEQYEALLRLARQKAIPVTGLHAGLRIEDGELLMTCLHPAKGFSAEDTNAYSAVLDIRFGEFNALMTGDLGEAQEQMLLAGPKDYAPGTNYELLKVAHHGSRFSTSAAFLEQVSPGVAVISAGPHNVYGHPHPETMERLRAAGASVYCTAPSGEVIVTAGRDGSSRIAAKLQGQTVLYEKRAPRL